MPPRAAASSASIPSRTASDTWSQILSGCPSDTDSLVNSRLRIFIGLPRGTAYVSSVVAAIATTAKYDLQQGRSEEHTSELQSLMRISYAVFCLKKKTTTK